MDYAQKMTKTREEMNDLDLPWGGGDAVVVEDSIIDQRRWSTVHELVFRLPGMPEELAYRTTYSVGSTECQDESPWEYEAAECVLVRAVPVTRVEWLPVSEV